ncbi:hypothetical protein [Spirosoma sp. 48-14]|uniref:hypothetical protein n=1 Tax=Spirosoma sp. 48-14 TaxID=1895854 RepID=UPI000967CB85|nr:hypothetical protein [Spirosoma sp. 48-14]OJW76341.1 MAG: hypothetical protein BGO59_22745 [Spirosoma sp. 48-14]
MAQVKQTLATFMASFFGKSEKAISEKLSTDEHNQFTNEALELQEKISGLQSQVTNLEGERDTLQASLNTLQSEKTTLEGDKTTLQNSLTTAEADRDKYKAWFEKQAGVGAQLPDADATNQNGGPEMTDYNAQALAVFRKHKG